MVQVQLDPEEDPIRLQLLPIELSYLAEFSEKSDEINLLGRCGRVRKSRRRHQSLLCPYLAEISATRQYQYFAPRYGWIRRRRRHWLQPLFLESSYLAEFSANQQKLILCAGAAVSGGVGGATSHLSVLI